uniref:Uncharacterized protein n=1 Tax=Arundo donax TaxID=35708 RepID=A0A0A9DU43_ARUDO
MSYLLGNQMNFRVLAFSQERPARCLKIGVWIFQGLSDPAMPYCRKFYRFV